MAAATEVGAVSRYLFWIFLLGPTGYRGGGGGGGGVRAFSLDLRKRMPGIWKLCIQETTPDAGPRNRNIVDSLVDSSEVERSQTSNESDAIREQDILLKLKDDGSFRQCDEGYQEGRWLSGIWELEGEEEESPDHEKSTKLWLAINRQYVGPPLDKLLTGCVVEAATKQQEEESEKNDIGDDGMVDNVDLSFQGDVSVGRLRFPKSHSQFFEEPMLTTPELTGTFQLQQKISFIKFLPKEETSGEDDPPEQNFQQSDFSNCNFWG